MPSEKQYQERKENIAMILQYLRLHGKKSRRQIADALNLSWGCVSELVWILLSQNILIEEKESAAGKGRAPGTLSLNSNVCFLGVDINRNGLNGCICNLLGTKTYSLSTPLRYNSKEQLLGCVSEFVKGILKEHNNLFGIGFAMQGIYDRAAMTWEFSSEPPIVLNFEEDLQPCFEIPTVMEHDPNCILYGHLEHTNERKMILRLDKGIGAAIYSGNGFDKDNLLEIGYLVVNEKGQRLHDIVSLQAIQNACGELIHISAPDDKSKQFFETMGTYLGMALGNLCNLLRLDEILLCGDVTGYYTLFSEAMTRQYQKTVILAQQAKITVIPITDAAYGAAKMAMDRFQY